MGDSRVADDVVTFESVKASFAKAKRIQACR
jgi:hypothetical protein